MAYYAYREGEGNVKEERVAESRVAVAPYPVSFHSSASLACEADCDEVMQRLSCDCFALPLPSACGVTRAKKDDKHRDVALRVLLDWGYWPVIASCTLATTIALNILFLVHLVSRGD